MALLPALAMAGEPAMKTRTASAEFDRLFVLAQTELEQDKVDAITDWSFNDQKPFPCVCFETGEKWHYVWTRDLSYAADLALAKLDPERTKTSLRFKLGAVRTPGVQGDQSKWKLVAQDTGSGGSWPVSTDRVVWFLAARHLLGDPVFRKEVEQALFMTLSQDDTFAFDPEVGLYRGETSFLDWREQNYPAWTAKDTTFIAESFALSTNVLHYEALRLAERLNRENGDTDKDNAGFYAAKADALRDAINRRFWNESRGMYMSYIGPAWAPVPVESYDLLGTSLVITSGVAPADRAQRALANYPVAEYGSPVIWPQQPATPIYHNRAMWPFVSEYALRAARATKNAERIAFEIRSLMRGTAKAGSNMENYELTTQAVHFEDGKLSGPVVNSPRQLWSVAGYLDMVMRGVFGVEDDGAVTPMLPTQLVPELFGDGDTIALDLGERRVVLRKPKSLGSAGLLVAGTQRTEGRETIVDLVPQDASVQGLRRNGAQFAPPQPEPPKPVRDGEAWRIAMAAGTILYSEGKRIERVDADREVEVRMTGTSQCFSATNVADEIESLPSRTTCVGPELHAERASPRVWHWMAPNDGRYRVSFRYRNANGPINTGITAGVMRLGLMCDKKLGPWPQFATIVMPHNEAETDSTSGTFEAKAGANCTFALNRGTNMSDLDHFAHYTGGKGGASGPLNEADIGTLTIVPLP
ncbi:Six-hairpin glycosidase-like protein [Lysobacter sp. HX-5-24]|uniref:Six-hairpin glycosidase-like protein n=2 Tax=Noviluteimonas gilva TaxID=2682097 RepID=A0A7C9M572_9GAMM|nr:Six-hairpin glycosidase-like protein [Lysobacter gilvus]MUV15202.1 Six-hairpin glycosidase-like protein [Lysobacter gilvus]